MNERARTLITFLAADPGDLFSRYALAMEYRKEGMVDACVRELREVLRQDADYIGAYYQLGTILQLIDEPAEALLIFKVGAERAEQKGDMHSAKELREAVAMMEMEHE